MTTLLHLLAIAIATVIATVIIYRLIRHFEPELAKGVVILFAVFGGFLTSVASIKTNSPPARAIRNVVSGIVGAFTEGYPYYRETWPFNETTEAAVAGRASTEVPPIPDDMTATGVALYRIADEAYSPEPVANGVRISEWDGIDADNRGICANLPFAFPFNGVTYTNVGILSNGRIALGHATRHRHASGGLPIGYPGGLEIVAPFWGEHLLPVADNASVTTIATSNSFGVVWENLSTPASGTTSNTTVACVLREDGRMSWHYSPVHPSVVSNVTIGVQSGTNAWMLVNGGSQTNMTALFSQALAVELVPVGGAEWALADADSDGLSNLEEFMLGTNPNLADTDGDGPSDRWELEHGYPPDVPAVAPFLADTDGDGVADAWELAMGTDPLSVTTNWPCADTDCDGFVNYYETSFRHSNPHDASNPVCTNTYNEAVLVCEIDSSMPCFLVVATTNQTIRIPWVPGISPQWLNVFVPCGEPLSAYLTRDYASLNGGQSAELSGYWYANLNLWDYETGESVDQDEDFGAFHAAEADGTMRGWIPPGEPNGSEWELERWRMRFANQIIDICGAQGVATIALDDTSYCPNGVTWSSVPPGITGTGNPLVFDPSELPAGTYTLYASAIGNGWVTAEATVHIRRLGLPAGGDVINVDASDTSQHTIEIDEEVSYSPDGYHISSSPSGISSLTFVPADLDPGVAYDVSIWNGGCGSVNVTVNNLAIFSETEAEWPEDRARTNLGVGEVVNLCVRPVVSGVSWSCDSARGSLTANGAVAILGIRDVAGALEVAAILDGISLQKTFMVFAPLQYYYAEPYMPYDDAQFLAWSGGGCRIDVHYGPTNVCFENVWFEECYATATNVSGWYSAPENYADHDRDHGAFSPRQFESRNFFRDSISDDYKRGPWSAGTLDWQIPARWWIEPEPGSQTNFHQIADSPWHQSFTMTSSGTVSVTKFGVGFTRQVNEQSVLIYFGGSQQ